MEGIVFLSSSVARGAESKATSKEEAAVTVRHLPRVRPWEPGFPRGACRRLGDGSEFPFARAAGTVLQYVCNNPHDTTC